MMFIAALCSTENENSSSFSSQRPNRPSEFHNQTIAL